MDKTFCDAKTVKRSSFSVRILIGVIGIAGLAVVFLFQQVDVVAAAGFHMSANHRFLISRIVRFVLNDLFTLGLIYALFPDRKYIIFALWVQLAGVVFLLIPYLILKLHFPRYNGPFINFIHRLIVNPTLLLLLVPAFYYQRRT